MSVSHRVAITTKGIVAMSSLSGSKDDETARLSIGAIANISEDSKIHDLLYSHDVLNCIKKLLLHENIHVHREALRATSNMLTSHHLHEEIIDSSLKTILCRSSNADPECQFY